MRTYAATLQPKLSAVLIYRMVKKRLDVNNVSSVDKDDIKIQKTINDVTVTIDYEARVPLFWNVALALSFHKRTVVR